MFLKSITIVLTVIITLQSQVLSQNQQAALSYTRSAVPGIRTDLQGIESVKSTHQVTSRPGTADEIKRNPARPSSYTWSQLCGSMNAYGMLGPQQRPLQYDVASHSISFIHTRSSTYSVNPPVPAQSANGVIVASLTRNWGQSWDSTALWSNTNNRALFPQGGIYNPAADTSLSNRRIVACGETSDSLGFNGTWYASKSLSAFSNTSPSGPGAQQFFSSILTSAQQYPAGMARHGWSRNGFQITNDGVVHALGIIGADVQNKTALRGYAVLSGSLNVSGSFDWKADSIIPPVVIKTNGLARAMSEGQMIWNDGGTIGYIVGIGVLNSATGSNRGMQPIIYKCDKTLSPAATWTLLNGLDFNTTYSVVPQHLPPVPVSYPTNTIISLPTTSDFNITIDKDDKLHLGIIFMSGYSTHPDSLQYFSRFVSPINPTESYRWMHRPGLRPYIFDFIGNGNSPWKMIVVDSVTTESPGVFPNESGYNENPWDAYSLTNAKLPIDARLMLGKTPDGKYISFVWAESDTLFTSNAYKYNSLPDLRARLMAISHGTYSYIMNINQKQNLTENDNKVRVRSMLHYLSPVIGAETTFNGFPPQFTVDVRLPVTVTNSNFLLQAGSNTTWFGDAKCRFVFLGITYDDWPPPIDTVGLHESQKPEGILRVYPNPVNDVLSVRLGPGNNFNAAAVEISDMLGKVVVQDKLILNPSGEINIDVKNLLPEVYCLKVYYGDEIKVFKIAKE